MINHKILITGCGGFVGKFLLRELLHEESNIVYGVDKKSKIDELIESGYVSKSVADRFSPIDLDLTEQEKCNSLPEVDFIFHLAATNGTSKFYNSPWDVYFNSCASTINLLNRYKQSKRLKRFIYTSTSEVYASVVDSNIEFSPTSESIDVGFKDIRNPRWSYGGAKLSGEIAVLAAHTQFGMPFSIIRYHNVYGPDMGTDHVIPDFIDRGRRGVFELYGVENRRSFIYISDATEATLKIATNLKALNQIVHVGTMDMISMKSLAVKIMNLANWTGELAEYPAPKGSVSLRCPDTSFLNEQIGFTPRISLDQGLKEVLDTIK